MAWAKLDSKTLTSAGDTATTDVITTPSKFIFIIQHGLQGSGNRTQISNRFGKTTIDGGNNYSGRGSTNGGGDITLTSYNNLALENTVAGDKFGINYLINISTEEKLIIVFNVIQTTAGAAYAPSRVEAVGKWVNTSNQLDLVQLYNENAANSDYDVGSNLSVLGGDVTISGGIQNGLEFHETDTNKDYVFNSSNSTWYQIA